MAVTRLELGNLFVEKGTQLERRFLGSVLHMIRQILDGGYANPTPAQTAWANAWAGATLQDHLTHARTIMEWALVTNAAIQADPDGCVDGDLDYVVGEFAKTYA